MQLKGFAKSKHKVGIFVIIILVVALVLVCTSFAFYKKEDNHVFISSTVGTFGDVNLAIVVDGETSQDFPSIPMYDVEVDCGDNAIGTWNYKIWGLHIDEMSGKRVSCTLTFTSFPVYGVKREISSSSSAWERISLSEGKVANAQVGTTSVQNDFDNIYPWSDIKTYNYDTGTKRKTAWIDEAGFTFTPTGNVEVLTYIPEFYYRRHQGNGYEYVLITREEHNGFGHSEPFSVGRYTISGDETRVHSRSNQDPLTTHTITEFRGYATALGEGFQQLDYHYFILQLLYLVEYADYNSQAKLGLGVTGYDSNHGAIPSGGCDALGMHSGSADGTDKTSIIYRGIEDIFGNTYQFVDGINIKDNVAYINYNPSTYEVDTFGGYYHQLGYINSKSYGWISKLGYDANNQLIGLPTEVNDSASTQISDYYIQSIGNRIALVGGNWNDSSIVGLWFWNFYHDSTIATSDIGSRLLKTGAIN